MSRLAMNGCGSWLMLRELLGHTTAKNYDGSWVEYGSLVGVPIDNPQA